MNDILDLSKVEAGKLELHYVPVSLRDLLAETAGLFSYRADERGIPVCCEIDNDVPDQLLLDEVRMRQILFNVVGNALKFTEKGKVVVRAKIKEDAVEGNPSMVTLILEVEDSGIGIAPEQQQRIFKAFVQAQGQNERKFGGTGLGLTISKRLVEMMGGKVELESELGLGSLFRFVFPGVTRVGEVPAMPEDLSLQGDSTRTGSALAGEDGKPRGVLKMLLQQAFEAERPALEQLRMRAVQDFALGLKELGQLHASPTVVELGTELEAQAREFDVVAIPATLERLKKLIDLEDDPAGS
jgi:anti-sigma regulatory factor (Ser/Thr protein kinase)